MRVANTNNHRHRPDKVHYEASRAKVGRGKPSSLPLSRRLPPPSPRPHMSASNAVGSPSRRPAPRSIFCAATIADRPFVRYVNMPGINTVLMNQPRGNAALASRVNHIWNTTLSLISKRVIVPPWRVHTRRHTRA